MSSLTLSFLVFACVFGAALVVMIGKRFLPESHLGADSKEVLKLGMGLIATLAALVMGLLIATAKGTYDSQAGVINELSANYLLLDRLLARYGDEAKEARDVLKNAVEGTLSRIFPTDGSPATLVPGGDKKIPMETLYEKISDFAPKTETQRDLRSRALGAVTEIAQSRLRLFSRQNSALPTPFLIVLVFWLTILFSGYGLLAPGNATVVLVLFVCAASVAGAVFLMLELSTPFAGVMRVSGDPIRHALSLLGQ